MQHRIGLDVDLDSGDHEGHVSATLDRFNVLKFGFETLFDTPWSLLFVGAQSLNVRSARFDQNRILFVVESLLFHDGRNLIGTRR